MKNDENSKSHQNGVTLALPKSENHGLGGGHKLHPLRSLDSLNRSVSNFETPRISDRLGFAKP